MSRPVERYSDFHGHPPRRRASMNVHYPKTLIKIGRAVAIEYECDKLNGGGDGTKAVYRHRFETPCHVYMDERGKQQLYVIGKRLRITEAGIEN